MSLSGRDFDTPKLRKRYLEKKGKINCGYCKYHKGENDTGRKPKPDKYKEKRR